MAGTALVVGRSWVPPEEIVRMIAGRVIPMTQTWFPEEATVVFDVRIPRVMLAFFVGSALALAGAALQSLFRNPLVSPQMLGVSSGASFGGVLAMVLGLGTVGTVGGAFLSGLVALLLVLAIGRISGVSPLLMIVLGGVVVSALFSSLVSLITYTADPYTQLPAITFWLLGSLATVNETKILTVLVPLLIGGAAILALRWRLNVLALGDEDATALGVAPRTTRTLLLVAVALLTAGAVAVSGVIGWVGLIVPHIARLAVGPDNRVLLPASLIIGGGYLVLVDTIARALTTTEIPLGILTALIGAPFFVLMLVRFGKRELAHE
ncbi:iron ABC transporter permease [Leucobacter sp. CSA2]|uniref:Iron ABC transporter permease n=1 Tax=Leucobacter edaphi TaxID=2796472 RepID=A0A934QB16_9MICO|nr:iron ABC transporter permease [Leucobacter edaphi]